MYEHIHRHTHTYTNTHTHTQINLHMQIVIHGRHACMACTQGMQACLACSNEEKHSHHPIQSLKIETRIFQHSDQATLEQESVSDAQKHMHISTRKCTKKTEKLKYINNRNAQNNKNIFLSFSELQPHATFCKNCAQA